MSRLKLGVISALAVLGMTSAVFAGAKSYFPLTVNVAGHYGNGGLAETHNTADTIQYAECGSNATTGFCTLRDTSGTYYSCFTTDATLITVIRSMSPDSSFSVQWDTSGVCTYVLSYASSRVAPRSPQMRARAWWAVLGLAALAATFWLGTRLGAPASGERVIVERPAVAPPPVAVRTVVSPGLSRDDIRAVVREELAQHAAEAAPAAEVAPERVAELQAAVATATTVVAQGVERGVWGERERVALRTQLVHLGAAETHEVLTPLFQAINAQRVQLDGPPF